MKLFHLDVISKKITEETWAVLLKIMHFWRCFLAAWKPLTWRSWNGQGIKH